GRVFRFFRPSACANVGNLLARAPTHPPRQSPGWYRHVREYRDQPLQVPFAPWPYVFRRSVRIAPRNPAVTPSVITFKIPSKLPPLHNLSPLVRFVPSVEPAPAAPKCF